MVVERGRLIYLTSDTDQAQTIVSGLMHVHAHCILHDGTLANFIPPLSEAKLRGYWQHRLEEVEEKSLYLMVYLLPVASRTAEAKEPIYAADSDEPVPTPKLIVQDIEYEVAGTISLSLPPHETGPMRAGMEKLLVSPRHRQKGIARILIRELERVARSIGRWSLLLGTEVDSTAEIVYKRLGYTQVGIVRAHGICPIDGHLTDDTWFSKDLRTAPEI